MHLYFWFLKSRMLNHKIDYVIKCIIKKLGLEKVNIGNTEDENENSKCLLDKLYSYLRFTNTNGSRCTKNTRLLKVISSMCKNSV